SQPPQSRLEKLFLGVADAEVLDLAGDRVAAHAEEVRRLDAAAAGARKRLRDERALELARELIEDPGLTAREAPLDFLLERPDPVGRGLRRAGVRVAEFRRQV